MIVLRYKRFSDSKRDKAAPAFLIPGLAAGVGTGILIGKKSDTPLRKASKEAEKIIEVEKNDLRKKVSTVDNELKKLSKSKLGRKLKKESKKYDELLEKKNKLVSELMDNKKMSERFKEIKEDLAKKKRKAYTRKSIAIGTASGLAASGLGYGIYKGIKNKKNNENVNTEE